MKQQSIIERFEEDREFKHSNSPYYDSDDSDCEMYLNEDFKKEEKHHHDFSILLDYLQSRFRHRTKSHCSSETNREWEMYENKTVDEILSDIKEEIENNRGE